MVEGEELETIARRDIDSNQFMTIGTADDEGVSWVSPVWYASVEYREFFWVSSPDARHSRNIATRPQVSIVVFDSTAPVGAGQAVYVSAVAEELEGAARAATRRHRCGYHQRILHARVRDLGILRARLVRRLRRVPLQQAPASRRGSVPDRHRDDDAARADVDGRRHGRAGRLRCG